MKANLIAYLIGAGWVLKTFIHRKKPVTVLTKGLCRYIIQERVFTFCMYRSRCMSLLFSVKGKISELTTANYICPISLAA